MSADIKGPALTSANSPVVKPVAHTNLSVGNSPPNPGVTSSPSNIHSVVGDSPTRNAVPHHTNSGVENVGGHGNATHTNHNGIPGNATHTNHNSSPANSHKGNSVEQVASPSNNSTSRDSSATGTGEADAGTAKESKGVFHSEPYVIGGFVEPPFIKPIHFSDIDQWKLPDRNYYVFICISFVLGFFGTDHFYLRSFGTGIQKLIFNIFTLGFWWWWDVLQIVTDSNKVKAEGLTTPFDWVRGVGRGVFEDPVKKAAALESGGKIVRVKKDLFIYALLTMMLGVCGADKFYLGETNMGIAKLLSVFNIFTFLFGLAWVIWDTIKVLFYTESLLKDGISAPPPFSMLFPEAIKAGPLFMPEEVSKEQLDKENAETSKSGGFPMIGMDTFRFWYKELAVPMLQPTVGTAVKTVDKGVKLGEKAAAVGGEIMATGPKVAATVTGTMASALNPAVIMEQVQQAAANKAAARIGGQAGGGLISETAGSSGSIVAGTLLAVVLSGAGKFVYDIVNKQ